MLIRAQEITYDMRNISVYFTLLFLFFNTLNGEISAGEKVISTSSYFPSNKNVSLIYNSSFGESIATYKRDGEFTIHSTKADRFLYKQIMMIKENGVYIVETYQYLKIFLFLKKEGTFTYQKPLLRFPLPLSPGMKWESFGNEYSEGDSCKVKVSGKAFEKEYIDTKAGRFEAIRLESLVEGPNSKNKVTEWFAEGVGLVKAKIEIKGGGIMGVLRDILGYGSIDFELKEIKKN